MTDDWTLLIHGGAGRFDRATMTREADAAIRAGLSAALDAGAAVLAAGGWALDAVEAAVRVLEDDPAFNAGRGAALTATGGVELDAAIMDGATRAAGAVAGVAATRHPVTLARAVMTGSPHVLLAGAGADAFARDRGIEPADADWLATPERRAQLAALLADDAGGFDAGMKYCTVGAVARDRAGHLAAATSTGGVTGKRPGRIGDSPLIGAGTYADDAGLAVSCTGSGEQFIRAAAASGASLRARLGSPVGAALDAVLAEVVALGGTGGLIGLDTAGRSAWRFSTPGMNRGVARADGSRGVAIHGDEFTGQAGADG